MIDYLRYLAFSGRLRGFFTDAMYKYVQPSMTTGQHLRFAPGYLQERYGLQYLYRDTRYEREKISRFRYDLGYDFSLDGYATYVAGERPPTHTYQERQRPDIEIIIDIDPKYWTERLFERQTFEDIPILFRRAGPASGSVKTGEKLRDGSAPGGFGTLCGVFNTIEGRSFALTCGHVVGAASQVSVERRFRIWNLPLWASFSKLGQTRYHTMCRPEVAMSPLQANLDAALVELDSRAATMPNHVRSATIVPISSMFQEDPVRFRGASRGADTLARISAVTVRKSIDLRKDGNLHSVGDVLMLGHRESMYVVQRVSRPGDSGAAVRRDFDFEPNGEHGQWCGMVLGSDETAAFASYSEYLLAWAMQSIGDVDLDFALEI